MVPQNINAAYIGNAQRFDPSTLLPAMYAEDLRRDRVKLVANASYRKGQVLGEITAAAATAAGTITLAGTSGTIGIGVSNAGTVTYSYFPYNATPAQVMQALTMNPNIGPGGITVAGSGNNLTYQFAGPLANQPQSAFTVDNSRLVGGTAATAQTTQGVANASFAPYLASNTDGTQVARCVAAFDFVTDAKGGVPQGYVPAMGGNATEPTGTVVIAGYVNTQDLIGLDGAAITQLGRLVRGTAQSGVLRIL